MCRRQTFILIKHSGPDSLLLKLIRQALWHPELFDYLMTPKNMWRMWEVTCLLWGLGCLSKKKCKHSHISGKRTPNSDGSKSVQRRANMSHEFRHWNWLPMSDTRSWLCVWCHKSVWEVERRGEGISQTHKCGKPKANERTLRGKDKDWKCNRRRRPTSVNLYCKIGEEWVGWGPDVNTNVCVDGYNRHTHRNEKSDWHL